MKGKKLLFLFLSLLFPVMIFLFLKIFGENEFEVPVFHEHGDIESPQGCNLRYTTPYRIVDTVMERIGANKAADVYVVNFGMPFESGKQRISNEFGGAAQTVNVTGSDAGYLHDCVFIMEKNTSVVLIDRQRRIRGYYDGSDRDEVDRLIVEIKIILKQY